MIDGHIHIERGEYTVDWIRQFVDRAVEMNIDEIGLLEHCYMFPEFAPMYDAVRKKSDFVDSWFKRKAGKKSYDEYQRLIEDVRKEDFPVKINFGLEICYFKDLQTLHPAWSKIEDSISFSEACILWMVLLSTIPPNSGKGSIWIPCTDGISRIRCFLQEAGSSTGSAIRIRSSSSGTSRPFP